MDPEVLFHRNIRVRYPRGWANLEDAGNIEALGLGPEEAAVLLLVRQAVNGALSVAKRGGAHLPMGTLYFDYADADESSAESFSGDGYSFIAVTIPLAKDALRIAARLRSSGDVRTAAGLPASAEPNGFQFLAVFLSLNFVAAHEFCHHALGHQPDVIPTGDPRTASLRGNLQAQTRELAADGYAVMHLMEHVINGAFRAPTLDLLGLQRDSEATQDRSLFLFVLMAIAATWYRQKSSALDDDVVYLLTHPPRACRLSFLMEHAMVWCRGSRTSLAGVIDGQHFANFMYLIGVAVCDRREDADSSLQHAYMRSPEGQAYARRLHENLLLHKSLISVDS